MVTAASSQMLSMWARAPCTEEAPSPVAWGLRAHVQPAGDSAQEPCLRPLVSGSGESHRERAVRTSSEIYYSLAWVRVACSGEGAGRGEKEGNEPGLSFAPPAGITQYWSQLLPRPSAPGSPGSGPQLCWATAGPGQASGCMLTCRVLCFFRVMC